MSRLAAMESVWDYPRPPAVRACGSSIEIRLGGGVICRTSQSWQVLETSHPPTYYLPRSAFAVDTVRPVAGTTHCEWKGEAAYFDLTSAGRTAARAAWTYPSPTRGFEVLLDHLAVMPGAVDECRVDGEVVRAQPGDFYGGWITDRVVGPFKGIPGSWGW